MRFMVIIKANKDSEAGVLPDQELLAAMGKYNQELANAGVLLAGRGSSQVPKGPGQVLWRETNCYRWTFRRSKELIAGFWIFNVKSKEEAIDWVKRCPTRRPGESEIEIRQVFEAEDFGPALTPELREAEELLRQQERKEIIH